MNTLACAARRAYYLGVPATAGTGCRNPISTGAAAPFFDSGAFFMPAIPQWRAVVGNRKVGRSLCPVYDPITVRHHPCRKGLADSKVLHRSLL